MARLSVARPKLMAGLRKLTQPLYDTTVIGAAADGAYAQLDFFMRPIGQPMPLTGANKSEADTNMRSASKLGEPECHAWEGIVYELFYLSPDLVPLFTPDYVSAYEQSVFTMRFNTKARYQFPLSRIPNATALTGAASSGDDTSSVEFAYLHQGPASVAEMYDVTIGGAPVMITSNETFNCSITWPNGAVTSICTDRTRARMYFLGSYYQSL